MDLYNAVKDVLPFATGLVGFAGGRRISYCNVMKKTATPKTK
jgi:hypothetical protein